MGEGDMMPMGRHKRKYDPAYAKKVKEGGRKAEVIRKMSHQHHQQVEVPKAENELEKDLNTLND